MGIDELDADAAREPASRDQFPDADPDDLVLLDDLLGIRDATAALPDVAPDARRRRLTALINSASLARAEPAVYVIEDAHWIDEASESMLADFLAVIPQIPALMLITYRPEYRGALSRVPGSQTDRAAATERGTIVDADRRTARRGPIARRSGGTGGRTRGGQSVLRRGDGPRSGRARRA